MDEMVSTGFDRGWEAAKLDAFLYLARQGTEFAVTPQVSKHLVPLVEARMEALGAKPSPDGRIVREYPATARVPRDGE